MTRWIHLLLWSLVTTLAAAQGAATPGGSSPLRLRATIEAVSADRITVRERGGERIELALDPALTVTEVYPIALSDLKAGAFIGAASMPQADGTLQALEVVVFPESARGAGEGHRPYDLMPGSTMTNATVADLAAAPQGPRLTLRYKDGEKTLVVPAGAPVVTFKPADRSLLVAGAQAIVTAEVRNGQPTALRVLAGRNGFAPPM